MVILKKIKASTLMETLVATVLIVVVFMISSMILNNLFYNSIKNNTRGIETYLSELEYLYKNEKIMVPYYDDYNTWSITIESYKVNDKSYILFEAINEETKQNYLKQIVANQD